MKYSFDITGKRFDCLDFEEAVLCVDFPESLASTIEIGTWGTIFQPQQCELSSGILGDRYAGSEALYMAGWGKVAFADCASISVSVRPYKPLFSGETGFMSEKHMEYSRRRDRSAGEQAHEYASYSVLEFPYGYASIKVHASNAAFHFETNEVVLLSDYCKSPMRYGWQRHGRLVKGLR